MDVCFANPGTSEMEFIAAVDRVPGVRVVLTLFEGVATGAADGYARMAGKPAATLLHLGPGLANGLANLHNASRAPVPIVNVVGDHATYHRHHDAPLTSDIAGYARQVSPWIRSVAHPSAIGPDAAAAIAAAREPPGRIATLIVPTDSAWTEGAAPEPVSPPPTAARVEEASVAAVAKVLASSEPALLLFAGAATDRAIRHARRIAARTGARVDCPTFVARIARGAGPERPTGKLSVDSLMRAVCAVLPEGCILVDESVSANAQVWNGTVGAPPHDLLMGTGGSIGDGMPLSVGAAVAAPGRRVLTLQGDGSAAYTMQALWTHARERLDVTTVILANRAYRILETEYRLTGAGTEPGPRARRLMSLTDPELDWVTVARGMGVPGVRVDSAEGFAASLGEALSSRGPFLIEAVIR